MDEQIQQSEPTAEAKRSGGFASYAVWTFVVVMVYVLGSGPVVRWYMKSKPITAFYVPVWLAYEHSPFRKPLAIYWHLWYPAGYDRNGNPKTILK